MDIILIQRKIPFFFRTRQNWISSESWQRRNLQKGIWNYRILLQRRRWRRKAHARHRPKRRPVPILCRRQSACGGLPVVDSDNTPPPMTWFMQFPAARTLDKSYHPPYPTLPIRPRTHYSQVWRPIECVEKVRLRAMRQKYPTTPPLYCGPFSRREIAPKRKRNP